MGREHADCGPELAAALHSRMDEAKAEAGKRSRHASIIGQR